jgi:NADH-quinone oxidoreductase subunit E
MPRRVMRCEPGPTSPGFEDLDLTPVSEVVAELDPQSNLIAVLQRLQERFGYLPEPVVDELAGLSGIPASRIHGIVTFYAQFTTKPSGRHRVLVCHGTACHVAGADRLTQALAQELGVADGATTPDLEFSLGSVACMGACSQAPVMRIDEETYGNLSAEATHKIIRSVIADLGLEPRDLSAPDLASALPANVGADE